MRQQVLEQLVAAAGLHDVWRLRRALHDLHERRVDVVEPLGLLWELSGDVPAAEHGLHVLPHVLDGGPLLHNLADSGELADPALHLLLERQ